MPANWPSIMVLQVEHTVKGHRDHPQRRARGGAVVQWQQMRIGNIALSMVSYHSPRNAVQVLRNDIQADDLPEIGENLRQGFVQTQSKLNKWFSDFRKNFNDSDEDEPVAGQGTAGRRQDFGSSQADQLRGIQRQAETGRARRSQDQHRYDPDPQVMSEDFTQLELRDEEEQPPPKPQRPQANPNLFKPTPQPPQSGPVDEVDALYAKPSSTNRQPSPSSGKSNKWQPLTSVGPNPDAEENDPFALGDSEDEDKKKTDIRAEDTERLKKSASMAEGTDKIAPQPAERSGSTGQRDKEVEQMFDGKKSEE